MRLILPLRIHQGRGKDFILNLNNYRNAHHFTLNNVKKAYKSAVINLLPAPFPRITGQVTLHFKYFHGSRRKIDISNPCSIIDKFVCDALTEAGVWADDDMKTVRAVTYEWGGVDKDNPRCELTIDH